MSRKSSMANIMGAIVRRWLSFCVVIVGFSVIVMLILPVCDKLVIAMQESEAKIKGHLKPLGSHRPPNPSISTLDHFPHPKIFYEQYVAPGKPVVFKNLAKTMPAYHLWTDEYLKENFGMNPASVETGKKENRENSMLNINFKEFLDRYKEEDIYLVNDLFSLDSSISEMLADLSLPTSLRCGNFENVLNNVIMWFSSGGTNSVLHTDSLDNINCILSGTKQLFLADKKQGLHEKFDRPGSHSGVDVERVNMVKYPELQDVPWFNVTMETGDCLFIPYLWSHNVKSSNSRNLAVNFWLSHLSYFNESTCENVDLDKDLRLNEMGPADLTILFMHGLITSVNEVGVVNQTEFIDLMTSLMELQNADEHSKIELIKLFSDLDLNSDEIIDKSEIINCNRTSLQPFAKADMLISGYNKDEL